MPDKKQQSPQPDEHQETASKENTDPADKIDVDNLEFEVTSSMLYFESLKVRDTIIGRIAMLTLLSLSIVTISIPSIANPWWGKLIIAVFTVLPTVTLYWVGKNGYFLSISSLFHMILHRELNFLKMRHGISKNKAESIDEQRALLMSYVADCPRLPLLQFFHNNNMKKYMNDNYRLLADSPRFKEQLEINYWIFILAHFFACERRANEKTRIIRAIRDEVAKKKKP